MEKEKNHQKNENYFGKNETRGKREGEERSYEQTWDVAVAGGGVSGTGSDRRKMRSEEIEQNGYLGACLQAAA